MDGRVFADTLKGYLEGISGWDGVVYTYLPQVRTREEFIQAVMAEDERINVWFINRVRLSSRKWGEAAPRTPSQHRNRRHTFRIVGYRSVYKASSDQYESEEQFQNLVDDIEEELGRRVSMGVTDHTVFVMGLDFDIRYHEFGAYLCHNVIIDLTVEETVPTSYVL
jgi:hypothetical protein